VGWAISLASGDVDDDNDFGNYRQATKAGMKYDTLLQVPLSGWIIELWDVTGTPTFVESKTTGAGGEYMFMVEPGKTYAVCEVLVPPYMQDFPDGVTVPAGEQPFDCTTLTPNSDPTASFGPHGYQFSPLSGEEYLENDFGNYEEVGCTYTQGYWKTHSYRGPAGPEDPGWGILPAGPDTPLFDAMDYEGDTDELTWLEAFNTPPRRGNAWFILAHQWMAAYLNYYNGAGSGGSDVLQWLSEGADLLDHYDQWDSGYPLIPAGGNYQNISGDWDDRVRAIELADLLDQYNNGDYGVPHCDD
jgi:hypothetical protein